jgi:DNA-binding MarR family transcriptional regulator
MKLEDAIKQSKPMAPLQKALVNLIYTYHWHIEKMNQVFLSSELTMQQYNVLRILRGQQDKAVPVGEVKAVMLDRNPDLTRLCNRLEQKKLIERQANATNKRQILLKITPKGLEVLDALIPMMDKASKCWTNLNNEEAEQLSDLLDKMRG